MESLLSHLIAVAAGAGIVWYMDRSPKRQFQLMMEAIDEGKEKDKDWRFIRDDSGTPIGFRVMMGASGDKDEPRSLQ